MGLLKKRETMLYFLIFHLKTYYIYCYCSLQKVQDVMDDVSQKMGFCTGAGRCKCEVDPSAYFISSSNRVLQMMTCGNYGHSRYM
jgi:hypothetical protein